jgi:hypothetical protein
MKIQPRPGRPIIKPTRKITTFALNVDYSPRMQRLQIKRNGQSLNDLFNEAIELLLTKEGF